MSSSFLHYQPETWSPDNFSLPLSKLPNGTLQEVNLIEWFILADARSKNMISVSIYEFAYMYYEFAYMYIYIA